MWLRVRGTLLSHHSVRGKAPEDAIMGVTKRVEKELLR